MFETLKLLASDVDSDVQSGAEFLEKVSELRKTSILAMDPPK